MKKKLAKKSVKKVGKQNPVEATAANDLVLQRARAAAQVFSQIELRAVRLIRANTSLSITNNKLPSKISTAVEAGCGANLEERTVLSNVDVKVHAYVDEENDGQSSADITVVFQCLFHTTDQVELSLENFRDTGVATAIANTAIQITWPYIREHIQSMASLMGLSPFTIPLMRFGTMSGKSAPRD